MKILTFFYSFILCFFAIIAYSQETGWVEKNGLFEQSSKFPIVQFIRASSDNIHFWTLHDDSKLRKWKVDNGELIFTTQLPFQNIAFFDISADEKTALISLKPASTNFIYLYDFIRDTLLCTIDPIKNRDITYIPSNLGFWSVFFPNDSVIHCFNDYLETTGQRRTIIRGYHTGWNAGTCQLTMDDNKVVHQIKSIDKAKSRDFILIKDYFYYFSYNFPPGSSLVTYTYEKCKLFDKNFNLYNELPFYPNIFCFANDDKKVAGLKNNILYRYDIASKKTDTLSLAVLHSIVKPTSMRAVPKTTFFALGSLSAYNSHDTSRTDAMLSILDINTAKLIDSVIITDTEINWLVAELEDGTGVLACGDDGYIRLYKPKFLSGSLCSKFTSDKRIIMLGDTISFVSLASGYPDFVHWDFGDGTTSISNNPTHVYSAVGKYTVRLTVGKGTELDTLALTDYISVHERLVADFTVSNNIGEIPLTVSFFNMSKGNIMKYSWDFGNGEISSEKNPVVVYNKDGIYNISLSVFDDYFTSSIKKSNLIQVAPKKVKDLEIGWEISFQKTHVFVDDTYLLNSFGFSGTEAHNGGYILDGYGKKDDKIHILPSISYIIKLNQLGEKKWETAMYNTDRALNICNYSSNTFATMASGYKEYGYVGDLSLIKVVDNGNSFATSQFPIMGNSVYLNMLPLTNGGIAALGHKQKVPFLLILDSNNKIANYTEFNIGIIPEFERTKINYNDAYGFLVLNGSSTDSISLFTLFHNNGELLRQLAVKHNDFFVANDMVLDKDLNIYVCGVSNLNKKEHASIIKLSMTGNIIWQYLDSIPKSKLNSIILYNDCTLITAGESNNNPLVTAIDFNGNLIKNFVFEYRIGSFQCVRKTSDNGLFLVGNIMKNNFHNIYAVKIDSVYDLPKSISPPIQNDIRIFPNPSKSLIQINVGNNEPLEEYIITDIYGREKFRSSSNTDYYNLTISPLDLNLATGTYFVSLRFKSKVIFGKFIFISE